MARNYKYISLDRILSKVYRDIGMEEVSETDVIEWSGEALEFMSVVSIYEEAIAQVEINNHQGDLPFCLQIIRQVARDNYYEKKDACKEEIKEDKKIEPQPNVGCTECGERIIKEVQPDSYFNANPFMFLTTDYYKEHYTPVRLSNHTFFNSLVCVEDVDIYKSCIDEYTIVEDKIRTSFEEGLVLVSYYRQKIDPDTGYPMIPDTISLISAITYYITWKYFQRLWYMGREGMSDKMQQAEERWLKYCKQATSEFKMLSGIDEHQNFMESRFNNLIPNRRQYYGYFGNLGRLQRLNFRNNGFN
jgi:hypothetical protein|nr:MAG TPA: hypothetical protein [Caudoviricetes sp.]